MNVQIFKTDIIDEAKNNIMLNNIYRYLEKEYVNKFRTSFSIFKWNFINA